MQVYATLRIFLSMTNDHAVPFVSTRGMVDGYTLPLQFCSGRVGSERLKRTSQDRRISVRISVSLQACPLPCATPKNCWPNCSPKCCTPAPPPPPPKPFCPGSCPNSCFSTGCSKRCCTPPPPPPPPSPQRFAYPSPQYPSFYPPAAAAGMNTLENFAPNSPRTPKFLEFPPKPPAAPPQPQYQSQFQNPYTRFGQPFRNRMSSACAAPCPIMCAPACSRSCCAAVNTKRTLYSGFGRYYR